MLLETLQIYCDVVESNSFSKGAKLNGITQSRASQSVHKLEEHFGVALIDRSSRPWTVTKEGLFCREECLKVLGTYKGIENRFKSSLLKKEQSVKVGTIYSVGFTYMPRVKSIFDRNYSDNELEIQYLHPDQVVEKVRSGDVDLGVVSFPTSQDEFEVIPLKDEEMVAVVAADHPLVDLKGINVSQLNGLEFVAFDKELVIARETESFLSNNGIVMRHVMNFDNVEAIKRAIETSSYVSILPKSTLIRELNTGTLIALPFLDVQVSRPLGVIYKKGQEITAAMQRFIELLFDSSKDD